ncbi:MAG: helix-turn-helix domain-containing protein [Egibacteraceae bacterium]
MERAKRVVPGRTPGPSRPAWSNAELAGMSVGQRIAFFRCRLGMAQLTLAQRVGRSESWLAKVERGDRGCDSLALIDVDLTSSRPCEADEGVRAPSAQRGPSVAVAGWASGVQSALELGHK